FKFRLRKICLGLSTEAHVIIHIEDIEPARNVFALGSEFGMEIVEIRTAFRARWSAAVLVSGPFDDFGFGAFVLRVGLDPLDNFPAAVAGSQCLFQRLRIDTGEIEKMFVERPGTMILAAFAVD